MIKLYQKRLKQSEKEYDDILRLELKLAASDTISQRKVEIREELLKLKKDFKLVISFDYQMVLFSTDFHQSVTLTGKVDSSLWSNQTDWFYLLHEEDVCAYWRSD